jgi:hypothetical protein
MEGGGVRGGSDIEMVVNCLIFEWTQGMPRWVFGFEKHMVRSGSAECRADVDAVKDFIHCEGTAAAPSLRLNDGHAARHYTRFLVCHRPLIDPNSHHSPITALLTCV